MSGARWEIEWPASWLDTIMATRLFGCPAKWLDAFVGQDSSVASSLPIATKWLLESEDNEYMATVRPKRDGVGVGSEQSWQMAEVTGLGQPLPVIVTRIEPNDRLINANDV